MKFDIVLGNPPYQAQGGKPGVNHLWPIFVKMSYEISKRYVLLVTPHKWAGFTTNLRKGKISLSGEYLRFIPEGNLDPNISIQKQQLKQPNIFSQIDLKEYINDRKNIPNIQPTNGGQIKNLIRRYRYSKKNRSIRTYL